MSLEQSVMDLLETLPRDHFYRVTYDQGARLGRWRIIAIDKKTCRDVYGASGPSITEAKAALATARADGIRWDDGTHDSKRDRQPADVTSE